jgi:hypothetical protein
MPLKLRHQGAWVTVKAGGLRFKESPDNPLLREFTPDTWVSPSKVFVKLNGQWNDTGYTPTTGEPGAPTLKSWSVTDPLSIEVQWSAPVTGVSPTAYNVSLISQAGAKLAGVSVTGLSATFSNATTANLLAENTNYSVTVTAIAPGAASATSLPLKVRIGKAEVTHAETTYDWSGTEYEYRPTFDTETSHYADMSGGYAVDLGDPAAGPLAPYTTAWVSGARGTPTDGWEGLRFSLPNAARRITAVSVITEPSHGLALGMYVNGSWIGGETLGAGPGSLLDHPFLLRNNDRSTNIRTFDVESQNITFSDVSLFDIAVTDFINLYGTPASTTTSPGTKTSTVTTTSAASIPPGYTLWIDATGLSVALIKTGPGGGGLLTPANIENGTSSSFAPFKQTPKPPASAVTNPAGKSWRLEYGATNDSIRFRWYNVLGPVVLGPPYATLSNGIVVVVNKFAIFNGKLGTVTNTQTLTSPTSTTTSTAAVPAWRARILDVVVRYRELVPSGTRTVVDVAQVNTVSGPSAW